MKSNKRFIRVLAIVLVLISVFATACSKSPDNTEETTAANVEITLSENETEAAVNAEITENTADVTESDTNENTTSTAVAAVTLPVDASQMTVKQIVDLYNTSANKIKPNAKSARMNYREYYSEEKYMQLPSAIEGIGKSALKTFVKGTDEPIEIEDVATGFPISGTNYTSRLTDSMVKSATCKDTGKTYEIKIVLLNDKIANPKKGEGYASVFNTTSVTSLAEANIPAVTFNKAEVKSINGVITCTIDKATGNMTELNYAYIDVMYLDVTALSKNFKVQLGLSTVEDYSIFY